MYINKNYKKMALTFMGIAIFFYQLHGINFGPTYENFKQKSYDFMHSLRASPWFWAAAGGSMLTLIILGLYKKSVFEQEQKELARKREEQKRLAARRGAAQLPISAPASQQQNAGVNTPPLSKHIASIIRNMAGNAEQLQTEINLLLNKFYFFKQATIPRQGDIYQSLINFFNTTPSFFRICVLLSLIPTPTNDSQELFCIYSIRHLLAMLASDNVDNMKQLKNDLQLPDSDAVTEYFLAKWKKTTERKNISQLIEKVSIMQKPHGKIIVRSILAALQAWCDEQSSRVNLVAERIKQFNRLYALMEFLNQNVIAIPKEFQKIMDILLSDNWVRLQDTNITIAVYEQMKDILAILIQEVQTLHRQKTLNKQMLFDELMRQVNSLNLQLKTMTMQQQKMIVLNLLALLSGKNSPYYSSIEIGI